MKKLLLLGAICTFTFMKADAQVPRNCFMEDFGSSTCPPCWGFNQWFDPWEASMNANAEGTQLVVIKWQMNWPSPGNDASYNNDGLSRRTHYSVTGVPSFFANGTKMSVSSSSIGSVFNNCKSGTSDLEITGTYDIKPSTGEVMWSYDIKPHADVTGSYTIHAALTDAHYQNSANTTGQLDYTHVMRKLVPSPTGKAQMSGFTKNTNVTNSGTYSYTVGSVTQMSNNFWDDPVKGHLIIWVENNATKEVVQSKAIRGRYATSVDDVHNVNNIVLYPNPATQQTGILFNLNTAAQVKVSVTDALGRVVYTDQTEMLQSGANRLIIPTSNMAVGNYNVTLQSSDGSVTNTRLSVVNK